MRAGTILPLGPVMQHVDEKLYDPLTIELYAPRSKSCHVIHDELNSNTQIEYKTDSLSLTVHTNTTPGKIELIVNSMSDKLTHVNGKPKRLQTVSDGIKIDLNRKEPNEVIVLTRGSASQ
jgi:alpha-glucosidase (family GH31 glycosyl hydrolase)